MMNNKRKSIAAVIVLFLLSLVVYSCYPDYGLSTADYDTVITLFDNQADFTKPTYAMPDTVVHFVKEGTPEDEIDRSKDALILQTIASNMANLGYQRVPVDTIQDPPGYVMLVGVTTTDNYGAIYYPGWGYWPGWGWWGGYPGWGYPGGSVVYSYTTGTIFMTMIDPDKRIAGEKYGAVWLARLNGVLSNSLNTSARITQRINDAFKQSPYLGTN